jgi:hypothetical protein
VKSIGRLTSDRILATPHCLFGGEALAAVESATVIRRPLKITPIGNDRGRRKAAAPEDIESVSLGSALWILNSNYSRAVVLRSTHQFLTAAPVHAGETEICRIRRHYTVAFESAPLRRLSRKIS